MLKRTYIDDPLSGRRRRSLKPPLVGAVTVPRSLFTHVGCSDAVSCEFLCLKIVEITELFALFCQF